MLKITNVAHYVGCDIGLRMSAVEFCSGNFFLVLPPNFPHIKYKYNKKGAKKGDKRTQKQRLQIHV